MNEQFDMIHHEDQARLAQWVAGVDKYNKAGLYRLANDGPTDFDMMELSACAPLIAHDTVKAFVIQLAQRRISRKNKEHLGMTDKGMVEWLMKETADEELAMNIITAYPVGDWWNGDAVARGLSRETDERHSLLVLLGRTATQHAPYRREQYNALMSYRATKGLTIGEHAQQSRMAYKELAVLILCELWKEAFGGGGRCHGS